MSCHMNLTEIFGDETIEVVDLGDKYSNNLGSNLECLPDVCADVCAKRRTSNINENLSQASESEMRCDTVQQIFNESCTPLRDNACGEIAPEEAGCCVPDNTDMCSPEMLLDDIRSVEAESRVDSISEPSTQKDSALGDNQDGSEKSDSKHDGNGQYVNIETSNANASSKNVRDLHLQDGAQSSTQPNEASENEITEADLLQQRQQLIQQSTERVKHFQNLHSYREQEGLMECSSGESGAPMFAKGLRMENSINGKLETRSGACSNNSSDEVPVLHDAMLKDKTSVQQAATTKNEKNDVVLGNETHDSENNKKSVELSQQAGKATNAQIAAHDNTERTELGQNAGDKSQPSVDDLISTFLSTDSGASASTDDICEDKTGPSKIASESTLTKNEGSRPDDSEKNFLGCQFGCLGIRVNLDHSFLDFNKASTLPSPLEDTKKDVPDHSIMTLSEAHNQVSIKGGGNTEDSSTPPKMNGTSLPETTIVSSAKNLPVVPLSPELGGSYTSIICPSILPEADNGKVSSEAKSCSIDSTAVVPEKKERHRNPSLDSNSLLDAIVAQIEAEKQSSTDDRHVMFIAPESNVDPNGHSAEQQPTTLPLPEKSATISLPSAPEDTKTNSPAICLAVSPNTDVHLDNETKACAVGLNNGTLTKKSGDLESTGSRLLGGSVDSADTEQSVRTEDQYEDSIVLEKSQSSNSCKIPAKVPTPHRPLPKVNRVSRIVAPKIKSPVVSKVQPRRLEVFVDTNEEETRANTSKNSTPRNRTHQPSPKHETSPKQEIVLTNVPLYSRSVARKKNEKGPTCNAKYAPQLHKSRAACESCLYWASDEEKRKFEATGYHLRIMKCRGGCNRDCAIFPRAESENPVRLCKKCFFDTHYMNPTKKGEDDDSSSVVS